MASIGKLVLLAGLAFLVLAAAEDHVKHGPAEADAASAVFITAAAAATTPAPEVTSPPARRLFSAGAWQRPPIPPSGPSDQFNGEINGEKPSSGSIDGQSLAEAP
ncbi:hypothetical protein HU200_006101 [Digitaria exilis]|uniref:Uncharacterized protein n=1 Tax=Digitaria exilis TaxID=1010633 RepID=A0A835FQS3_9POAL|nr:hypothetical protein HU200_006101 [Digitaria exilis]